MALEEFNTKKQRKNIGDAFKYLVTDNWKTELVMTINARSLKNFFKLRDSGAAWFQIQALAKKMISATPEKIIRLIHKDFKN
jgi:thymidylate synthase (FAD)